MTRELRAGQRPNNLPKSSQFWVRRTCACCGISTKNFVFLEGTGTYICTAHTIKRRRSR